MNRIKFNDLFAIWITALVAGMWIAHGRSVIVIPEIILGATTTAWASIIIFYFRKKPDEPK